MAKEKIILAVSKYPELYNKGQKHYKDMAMRENIWQSISRELDITADDKIRGQSSIASCVSVATGVKDTIVYYSGK
ncbi:UNVERIFIED_CONTAM: hypothetical protein FKN15_048828 [Acipenser sinensis]